MLKSCSACGRIHDSRYICPAKQQKTNKYPKDTAQSRIRNSSHWQKTREYIRERDQVCQLCLRNYPKTIRPYEGEGLSVHHITKLEDDESKAFDELNLITLCSVHHEMAEAGQIDASILRAIAKENSERRR